MFQDGTLYPTTDPALLALATAQTLAHWRSQGRGPPYIKSGARVLYWGRDLNAWLESRTVRPTAA